MSQAESGSTRIGARYLSSVLAACKLEPNFGLRVYPPASEQETSDWAEDPRQIAGLDPETLDPVRRGSARDEELSRTFVWWNNGSLL